MTKDKVFWAILILASIYIIANIGTGSLTTWDEAVYANASRGIAESGHWLILHIGTNPWFEKPPLYMWFTAIAYKIFGINEFSTRFTSAVFAIATVLLVYIFALKSSGRKTAVASALALLGFTHYLHFAKMGMLDVALTFFILLMVYFFYYAEDKRIYLFLSGLTLSLAYLVKGFSAFLGPVIIILYAVFSGNLRKLFSLKFILGILASFTVIFFWHFAQYLSAGPQALSKYFNYHIYQRATQALDAHSGGPNFYQKAIFNKNIPWSVLMYISVLYILWLALAKKDRRATLLCFWIALTYILFSIIQTKLHWYIIPIYPALAISSGIFLGNTLKGNAFKVAIVIILAGLLIQVPFSWAFKLDFNPEVKKSCAYAKKAAEAGDDVYMAGIADAELFYCDFAKPLNKELYNSVLRQKKQEAFCVAVPEYIEEYSQEYNFEYAPVYETKRISIYKIKFKFPQPSS